MTSLTPSEKMIKAKIKLQDEQPFFSFIASNLEFKEENLPVMAITEGGEVYYNPDWVKERTLKEIKTAICHEVLHIAQKHFDRQEERQDKLWNVSIDHEVNNILKKNNFNLFKELVLFEEYQGKIAEEVYDLLADDGDEVLKQVGSDTGEAFDEHKSAEDSTKGESEKGEEGQDRGKVGGEGRENGTSSDLEGKEESEKDWDDIIVTALELSKQRGNIPRGVERVIDDLLTSKKDWKEILWDYVNRLDVTDYTWTRPHKKSRDLGIYLPDTKKEGLDIVIGMDTSGSVWLEEVQRDFLNEIKGILHSYEDVNLTLIEHDKEVQNVTEVTRDGDLEAKGIKGGGGTSHKCVFNWIEKEGKDTELLINFTDGYTEFPDEPPLYDVLWMTTKDGRSIEEYPFGRCLELS